MYFMLQRKLGEKKSLNTEPYFACFSCEEESDWRVSNNTHTHTHTREYCMDPKLVENYSMMWVCHENETYVQYNWNFT
jgi:hypothetical protein